MTTAEESSIFDALPGQLMPVADVSPTLSRMWNVAFEPGHDAPSEFRASQMNLILHFGLKTSPDEAFDRFNTAIAFAQKYPCRIVVLCPMGRESSDKLLEGKLFSQCYIGESMRDMCCCEAVILGYPTREAGFLSSQVSIWLENDLPTYHWFNRIPAERVTEMHMDFVKRCRRVLFDSSVEREDGNDMSVIDWPRPEGVVDLAWARILHVRQSLGQFLSTYEPVRLAEGLTKVESRGSEAMQGEAANLLKWCRQCLAACADGQEPKADYLTSECVSGNCLELEWTYTDGRYLRWSHRSDCAEARLEANFGAGELVVPLQIELMEGDKALAEALFFA